MPHAMPDFTMDDLARTIAARAGSPEASSYTAQLLAGGVSRCAQKLGEEAVEAAIAAVRGDRDALVGEAADVLYHLLVLLQAADIPFDAVRRELARRSGTSGLAEKAARRPAP